MSDPRPLDLLQTTDDFELERFTAAGAQGIVRRFALVLVLLWKSSLLAGCVTP